MKNIKWQLLLIVIKTSIKFCKMVDGLLGVVSLGFWDTRLEDWAMDKILSSALNGVHTLVDNILEEKSQEDGEVK